MERQTIYGWPIAIDLFVAGAGAGAFLTGFVMSLSGIQGPPTGIILFAGPLLVLIGAFFLLVDITIRSRICRLFANRKSWTSRGAWILTIFIVSGFVYAGAAAPSFLRLPLQLIDSRITLAAGVIAALFSLLVLLYPGFLMSAMRAVPFWNTPLLPILFLLSGLSNGLALAIVIMLGFLSPTGGVSAGMLQSMGGTTVILIFLQALVLAAFLMRASRGNVAARESLRLLTRSFFPWNMFALGLFVPFGLFFLGIFTTQTFLLSLASVFAAIFLLAGGVYLRHAIVQAGVYLPRFTI